MKDEKGNPITYWGGIIDDDVYNATEKFRESYKIHGITEFEVSAFSIGYLQAKNKAKEDYEVVSSVREVHQYKLGLEDGYNKAKETFYTKEQLMEVIELARLIDFNGPNVFYMSEDEIIKALKP